MAQSNDLKTLYNERKETIASLQNEIAELVRDLDNDGPINWGHAGSLGHVVEELQNIREFLRG